MNIALLIDCENAVPDSIHGFLSELAEKGTINIRRAYGNWKNQAGWEEKLHPFAIQPQPQVAYTKGKNMIAMCTAIDAMNLRGFFGDRDLTNRLHVRSRCQYEPNITIYRATVLRSRGRSF